MKWEERDARSVVGVVYVLVGKARRAGTYIRYISVTNMLDPLVSFRRLNLEG